MKEFYIAIIISFLSLIISFFSKSLSNNYKINIKDLRNYAIGIDIIICSLLITLTISGSFYKNEIFHDDKLVALILFQITSLLCAIFLTRQVGWSNSNISDTETLNYKGVIFPAIGGLLTMTSSVIFLTSTYVL